jgi:predicted glycogen debranching enzyme
MVILPLLILSHASSQPPIEQLAIDVKGASREFAFTNKHTAFLYGETHSTNRSSWQGFNVSGYKFLDDYEIWINEKKLDRSSALSVVVYPDYLKRLYADGIVEELRLVDSIPLFSVTILSPNAVHVDVIPLFSDGQSEHEFVTRFREGCALIARKKHLVRTEKEPYPVWLAMHGTGFLPQKKFTTRGSLFSPIMAASRRGTIHTLAFSVADTPEDAQQNAVEYIQRKELFHQRRRERMEQLLQETFVQTENADFNKALAWAKLSLDALIMNQRMKGIFAGLPWFNNYWGRDTFIALPGATLVQGRFTEAKEILKSFAAHQQKDSNSSDYGRIPNIITTTERAYNTADATPRFVMMAREYVERSGDTTFLREIYPTIVSSIEGTLRYHCDSLGFLTHADAETWMDAVGPDGPWTPRGNRANDVQALWAQQLEAGVWFANHLNDSRSATRWSHQLNLLKQNFLRFFVREANVIDHLNADGSPDNQVRPNQIFTTPLLPEELRAQVLQTVVTNLTYEHGVASLSQDDENFHPYHIYPPYYPKDAAYHNGTVWTWLQGSVISELCHFNQQDFAFGLTLNAVHQILERGAVGTQSELLDALPRPGESEPRLSGTFSQAWNLAEFIRNFYDDYLGIRVSLLDHRLVLRPRLPKRLGSVNAVINLNGRSLPIEVRSTGDSTLVHINGTQLRRGGTGEVNLLTSDHREVRGVFRIPPFSDISIVSDDSALFLQINGVRIDFLKIDRGPKPRTLFAYPLAFARPSLRSGLRALQPPRFPVIPHAKIKAENPAARKFLSASDPAHDDRGSGAYTYPLSPHFVAGGFDIMRFDVSVDDSNAYFSLKFRALANPGWHLEYGFQLTFVAIAIDEDGLVNSGQRSVGRNANYLLPPRHAYEKVIYVGGGVQLEDKDGRVLAAYIPREEDVSNPLGNAERGTISFAIPLTYLGKPTSKWTFTVLVGGQDDHGGAGLGEFRTVNATAGEWNGGGKLKPDEPNVYDVLVAKRK